MKNFTLFFIFLAFPLFSILNAQCFEVSTIGLVGCDGEQIPLTLNINGGEAPYVISWSTGSTSGIDTITEQNGSFILLIDQSGSFNFSITDNTGCTETTSAIISFPPPIVASVSVTSTSGCDGECNGFASVEVLGGTGPYTYTWNSVINASNQISDLCPGDYSVTVTDSNGCEAFTSFTLEDQSSGPFIELSQDGVTPVSCLGGNDGAIDLTVVNGLPPYTFFWTGPNGFVSTLQNLTNLSAGTYTIVVVDNNGCPAEMVIEVPQGSQIEISYSTSGIACLEEGFISIDSVWGGVPPFTYAIDGGPFMNAPLFDNLTSGTYLISVLDNNGCITVENITIESQILMEVVSTFSDCDSLGGSALATIISGATNPVFTWSNGTTGPELTNAAPGGYSVTVTDNLTNCVTHQNVEILYDPGCFVRISGRVILDQVDEDCVEDASSGPLEFILVALDNGDLTFTDSSGYYEFETAPGTYEVSIDLNSPFLDPLCADPITVSVPEFGDISEDHNFWVTYSENQDLAVSVFSGPVRPGFDQSIILHAHNYGGTPMDGTLTFSHDEVQTLLSSGPVADDYDLTNTTLSWDFVNLNPGVTRSFIIRLNTPPTVELGTPITYTATIGPTENDIDLANNTKIIELNVTGSFDPNDKQVSPRGEGDAGHITRADSTLSYQIRFQNTGTDTAFTVVILDKIEENLDITTVRPGASSHPYRLNIIDGNKLEFRFENILLPDSFVNEPASNGFVLFEIQTKKDLPFGSTFENTAEIYFDFNEPIITNTVINTLTAPTSLNNPFTFSISTQINPNPGGAESVLFYSLEEAAVLNLGIYDLNGKLLKTLLYRERRDAGNHQQGLESVGLPQGVYLVRLETEAGVLATQKWVKME